MRLADLCAYNAARAARRPVALVSDLDGGTGRVVDVAALTNDPLGADIANRLRSGRSGAVEHGGRRWFVTVAVPPVRILAVGAVHISQALAALARPLGLDVTVLDPRTAFATPERFPGITLLPDWPDEVLPDFGLDGFTAVALLTHDPKIDDPALVSALRADCFYIGALGSRKTHAKRIERMRAHGFSDADLARVHAPIGLDIGAVSPAEIALAILGEIVAARRVKPKRDEATSVARAGSPA